MNVEYLLEKYGKLVYKICYDMLKNQEDAEDLLQETYFSLYKNLNRYLNLPENDIQNIICKIALNKCRDLLKSKSKKLENLTDYDETKLENYLIDNKIDEQIYLKDRKMFVIKMINELKMPYRQILYDYYIDQKSLDEIAKSQDVLKDTLKVQLYRAKKLLKEKLVLNGGDRYI